MGSAAPSTLRRVIRTPRPGLPDEQQQEGQGAVEEAEEVDALPVLIGGPALARAQRLPRGLLRDRSPVRAAGASAVQAAAVAAGGFVAGAAVVGLVHRRQRQTPALAGGGRIGRALARSGSRRVAQGSEVLQIVSSRTLLVDVHVLGTPGSDR